MSVRANVFPKLQTVKTWVNLRIKSAVSEHPLTFNMLKGSKHLGNLHEQILVIFSDHCEEK